MVGRPILAKCPAVAFANLTTVMGWPLLGDRPWHWQVSAHLLRLALASLASGPLHIRGRPV